MKRSIYILSLLLIFLIDVTSIAQKRTVKVAKNNRAQKAVVVKSKKGNKATKAVVVKGKKGNKAAVVKTNKSTGVAVRSTNNSKRVNAIKNTKPKNSIVSHKRTRSVNHRYVAFPKRGGIVTTVHRDARIYRFGGLSYRFYKGVWYKPYRNQWIVVRPNFGFSVNILPVGYTRIRVLDTTYFYYYGTFYMRRAGAYVVVNAPLGAEVISIPSGYTSQVVSGVTFYELDGVYYKSKINTKGEEVLVVVKKPKIIIT
ncbi:MAG: DUF6515 family protein [Flavicella sp.]